ncbi:MAG: hypothetical protein SEPTF4163_003479 [Sporothrix epigloea]
MAAAPSTPRLTSTGRRRGRPPGSTNAARAARMAAASSEPPPKRRKYIPGGPGGGGRFVDEDGVVTYVVRGTPRASIGAGGSILGRTPKTRAPKPPISSPLLPRRERSTRTRIATSRYEPDDEEQFSSAAAVAAAVVQSEGYKPREERGWEEFHPNLDIETMFMVFRSEDVDGKALQHSATPIARLSSSVASSFDNGTTAAAKTSLAVSEIGATPLINDKEPTNNSSASITAIGDTNTPIFSGGSASVGAANVSQNQATTATAGTLLLGTPAHPETPLRRRIGRPPREANVPYGLSLTPKTPRVLPINNQTPKEKLDLKLPSYRKTDRILLFEGKTFSRYVDKSMMNVGYQESDVYIRPEKYLLKASDANAEEEIDALQTAEFDAGLSGAGSGSSGSSRGTDYPASYGVPGSVVNLVLSGGGAGSNGGVGRVEYDMDEQDDMWLSRYNEQRKAANVEPITREIFEITITKIEKEWHALEKRIPKPNPKPPQTHRPRSSSAAAVNGETQGGEEQDSKCAICDDGDCENTNAIVFCDGCDLAVHQDCYGVPFIPEGQWLCRKCQLIGRGVPTCIFCPNTDGAFKQTNSSKWAHMLCAMWIPETSLGNATFMEPIMDVDKVPKTRWRLTCYICRQKMGACIQCSNKDCYQAFHVTCARRASLYLKMKNSHGALAVLDNSMVLKAFCDRHCPPDYAKEINVHQATKEAKKHYKRIMRGRIWADSRASALQMAATTHAMIEHPVDESQLTGARISAAYGAAATVATAPGVPDNSSTVVAGASVGGSDAGMGGKKKGAVPSARPMWKLPSGAPVIPQAVNDIVETALQRFMLRRRREYVSETCRYWTLKREARRGAALLKRLQLQMETFTSLELTRRNFATIGPTGRSRLERRIEFAETLIQDLKQLRSLADDVVEREREKLEMAELEEDFVDTCYFPIHKLLAPVIEKAKSYDKVVFQAGFASLQSRLDERFYTSALHFVQDLSTTVHRIIYQNPECETDTAGTSASLGDDEAEMVATSGKNAPHAAAATAEVSNTCATVKLNGMNSAHLEVRDRKRLGKRILKAIQPMLEAAIRVEADITRSPLEPLQQALEKLLEAGVEMPPKLSAEDEVMEDAKIGVDEQLALSKLSTSGDVDERDDGKIDDGDKMDVDGHNDPHGTPRAFTRNKAVLIEITTPRSSSQLADGGGTNGAGFGICKKSIGDDPVNGTTDLTMANGPFTPPQSHSGSVPGKDGISASQQPMADPLHDGGSFWYLDGFQIEGTTVVEEQRSSGRDTGRLLSEELTEVDDEELNGLGFDLEDSTTTTKTVALAPSPAPQHIPPLTRSQNLTATTPKRRNAAGAAVSQRKGVRSSARRR